MSRRSPSILIVEDLVSELEKYTILLKKEDFLVNSARSLEDAKKALARIAVDVVLTDIHLSSDKGICEGLVLLEYIKTEYPHVAAIAMSLDPCVDIANQAKRLGALQFLKKPIFNADEIRIAIDMAMDHRSLQQTHSRMISDQASPLPYNLQQACPDGIVISPEHDNLVRGIAKNGEIPVIILGESGTGKEEIAKLIHKRRSAIVGEIPFVSVNCANLSGDLVASILFGHKKGAFTGADRANVGLIGESDGGILFLDEIHSLSMDVQRRLLRVLNDGSYTRVGDTLELRSCFQVIAASTKDLDEEVEKGTFLIDLRTRLTGIDIQLAPLRDRKNDIPTLIALFFAKEKNIKIDKIEYEKLVARCSEFHWQGNIRQLYKVLTTLCVMANLNDEPILGGKLPVFKTMLPPGFSKNTLDNKLGHAQNAESFEYDQKLEKLLDLIKRSKDEDIAMDDLTDAIEDYAINNSIRRHKVIAQVATSLKMARSSLDAKRKKFGIE